MASALSQIARWSSEYDVPHTAAWVEGREGVMETFGDVDRGFRLASVSKLLTCYAILIAVQEEAVGLDDLAGPPGSTLRHLLAHAGGYGFDSGAGVISPPGTRRTYSNQGIEVAAAHVAAATGIGFGTYLNEAVFEPLGMTNTRLAGSPAAMIYGTARDLGAFATEVLEPQLLATELFAQLVTVQFPGLTGVMPGVGRFDPLDWGLGFELNFGRTGHWAGPSPSSSSFGHFGAAGTFLWADPVRQLSCVCLSDRDFGDWAMTAWPPLTTAVIQAYA